ncbi:hypothetical protein Terro_0906 [Terriglobus roseus DSM 18391]|uniref:DoxX-like family protein n=1 Tax=Terriglobus roseus (strain DSM 18391 / NRRL B-41598 / KBS 63) TaxID=926566 RepID=I3ZDB4_TERRK|nr:DoxX family protein [Terriglobus roseus]AFL87232.1 hypothetical protein Terro_0906 [Terriglobus roseus DSM 18391]
MSVQALLIGLSSAIFLVYGFLCFHSDFMVSDFRRFGVPELRILTGVLELLGGAGLLVGYKWPRALRVSSGGLALLMLIAFCVRVKVRDSILESLPSLGLMLLNGYILRKSIDLSTVNA